LTKNTAVRQEYISLCCFSSIPTFRELLSNKLSGINWSVILNTKLWYCIHTNKGLQCLDSNVSPVSVVCRWRTNDA